MNKKTIVMLVAAAALGFALALPVKVFSDGFNVNVSLGDEHHHHHDDHRHRFDHPEIDAAIGHLNEARSNLANAAHDFGGHRVSALRAVDNALRQCKLSVDYAESHDR